MSLSMCMSQRETHRKVQLKYGLLFSEQQRIISDLSKGELCNLDIEDINFDERECIVYGTGNKERRGCFDAKAKLHLQK